MTTTTTTADIATALHRALFGGRPEFAVTAWDYEGVGYLATEGTGEVSGPGACFLYEATDVASWLASASDTTDYDDFCAAVGPVEDVGVARALWRDLELVAHAGGLCVPVIPAPKDIDGDPIEAGDYIQTVGLSPEDSDFGQVLAVLPDGRLDVYWAGSESRTECTPADGLRIISSAAYRALREGR